MDINTIEQKIRTLEGGQFQKLCSALFAKKYPNYVLQPNGGSIGSNKTTKGHPDFLLKNENSPKFILVECTTKAENLEEKIKSDLGCCVNETITGIKNEEIEQIAFCYAGKEIDNSVYSEIANDLKKLNIVFNAYGIGAIASEIYNKYQVLAADFLGISVPFSKCVFELGEFVKESKENGLSPSLDKKFGFRDKELEIIRDAIKERHFVLLSGNAGVGKTKLALEFARSEGAIGVKWMVLKASGNPNIEEVRESLSTCSDFIIDDLSSFGQSIPDILQILKKGNVIATSRDYLTADLEVVLKNQNITFKSVVVDPLDSKSIEEIIKNNTEIKEVQRLNKIADIAKGNARIAFMVADEVEKNGAIALFNTKDVFANYYHDRIASIKKWAKRSDELFKIIGLACLLKKFSIESITDDDPMLKLVGISNKELRESLDFLNSNDIVCLFFDDIVTISDQCLADYFAYYVFLEKRLLRLAPVINAYFETQPDRIVEMINMFGSNFNSKDCVDYISDEVGKSWNSLKEKGNQDDLKLYCAKFALLNVDNSLSFLWVNADKKEEILSGIINGNVDWRLSAISSLLNVKTNSCCQIVERMILSNSIDTNDITKMLVQSHGINMSSFNSRFKTQKSVLSFFFGKKEKMSLDFLVPYCLSMLKFTITYAEGNGNGFNFYTLTLKNDDDIKELRKSCFDVIFVCGNVYHSLEEYFSDFPQKESVGLYEFDLKAISEKLVKYGGRSNIRDLILYLKAKRTFDYYDFHWESMEDDLREQLNLVLTLFFDSKETSKEIAFEEKERVRRERVLSIANSSSFEVNYKRIELCNSILEYSTDFTFEMIEFVDDWFSCLSKNVVSNELDKFLALSNFVKNIDKFCYLIVDRLIEEVGIESTYLRIVSSGNIDFKEKSILYFFEKASEKDENTSKALFTRYLENFEIAIPKETNIGQMFHVKIPLEMKHSFLKRYLDIAKNPSSGDFEMLFASLEAGNGSLFNYLLSVDLELVKNLYIQTMVSNKSYFDYDGCCLGRIVEKDNNFAVDVIKLLFERKTPFEYAKRIQGLWKLKEYISIGNLMFDFIRSKTKLLFFYDGTIMFGRYSAEGRKELSIEQLTWLSSYLYSHKDVVSIRYLNAMVRELGPETSKCYAKWLVNVGVSKELFADYLQPASVVSYSGSYVSVINSRIAFYQSLLDIIPDEIAFLDYRILINNQILSLKGEIGQTEKFEKLNDF